MKNLFFLFIIFQSLFLYSQNRKDYFVVVKPGYAYAPLQTTVNQDETLSFQMTDSAIENFLNSIPTRTGRFVHIKIHLKYIIL